MPDATSYPASFAPQPDFPSEADLRGLLRAEIAPFFAELRTFVDRRIAELSVEVTGATQLLGYSEDNLSSQLGRLHEQVARMVSVPTEASRNSGLELEAVVQTTEAAANQIMEAAEAIGDWVRTSIPDKIAMATISSKVDAIFEACSFQDITGQRVRRAIEQLQHMESALGDMMAPPGTNVPIFHPQAPTVVSSGPDLPQDDIDALFG